MINTGRVKELKKGKNIKGPVVYWMSRDQRVEDNWALLYALKKANTMRVPLYIVFALTTNFLGANLRHYSFLLEGLKEVQGQLTQQSIAFHIFLGKPDKTILSFIKEANGAFLVSDFDPLRIKQDWKKAINQNINIHHYEVDAHNIVPCRLASIKLEFGAYTFRPKINRLLNTFFTEIPSLPKVVVKSQPTEINWDKIIADLNLDSTIQPVKDYLAGFNAGTRMVEKFIDQRLKGYSINRNNPLIDGQSNLSPYLHFGQISAQRVAIEVSKANAPAEDKSAFLEELIVRRELSDNFCFYNADYDNPKGFHTWAKETLRKHKDDEREYIYSLDEFELAKTHDPLWNAAQLEMVKLGKMHGYMRMYWAKKILEWTPSPEEAMNIAIHLNDKYSLDGRDPNGYTGIAWSIGGVHDRAWSERPVFGKIRYMNYNGCKRKFDVNGYIERIVKL